MAGQATKRVHERSLRDSEIIDIVFADNFSDIPSDCELGLSDVQSDSGSEFDYDNSRKRKRPRVLDISSDSESDSDNCSPTRVEIIRSVGIDTSDGFCKEDPARKIEPFEGVRGLTCAPTIIFLFLRQWNCFVITNYFHFLLNSLIYIEIRMLINIRHPRNP